MNDRFFTLPEERRGSILNGAMAVFGKHGYKKASVDDIAARGGISKALLFHYFGSKKALFLFLYAYAKDSLVAELSKDYDRSETDFFRMLVSVQASKFAMLQRHPDLMAFLGSAYTETDPEVRPELGGQNEDLVAASRKVILSRADSSRFKEGVSMELVLDLILWLSEGLMLKSSPDMPLDLAAVNDKYLQCLDLLRANLYKEEAL